MTASAPAKKFQVLFLCTGNSARSILAEYFLKRLDPVRFDAFSAGAAPKGRVHPLALAILRDGYHIDPSGARSKSWDELKGPELRLRDHRVRQRARILPRLAGSADRRALGIGGSGPR